jgi:alpha-galactosidase
MTQHLLSATALAVLGILPVHAQQIAATPPMGWNSWNHFESKVDDKTVREIADAMVSSGLKDAGYVYVNIDDTWQGQRDAQGNIQANSRFPDMKALADYVHSKGLKIGIYSSPGPKTCADYEGSYKHEDQDAHTYAAWGMDYLKYDWCSADKVYPRSDMPKVYKQMADSLRTLDRPIVYSLCQYGIDKVWEWGAAAGGNSWRTTGDISDKWKSMESIGFKQNGLEKFAGPGRWNDPDMLEVGNGGMTATEYRTHMSLWSLLAAPLLAGNDLRSMTKETVEILANPEVIAVNQDTLGKQGYRVAQNGATEVWAKPLAGGEWAVGLFNRGPEAAKVTVQWKDLGGLTGKHHVRDLWAHADRGTPKDQFWYEVPSHGVVLLRVK